MNKLSSAAKIKMSSYDELFGTGSMPDGFDTVKEISLEELHEFNGHPFKVLDDEKMQETISSIKEHGVLIPGIARPRREGGYEIIAGHRRKHGCMAAGLKTMPMFVREYSDDEATVIMVDSNIQRETILPSEKARAYAMKYEALKHQGRKGRNSLEAVGECLGESGKTVQRYIWLARLSDNLLELVDTKKMGIIQGVELSFLSSEMQEWVWEGLKNRANALSIEQALNIKECAQSGELTPALVGYILAEKKKRERKITIKKDRIADYFTEEYSDKEIEQLIYQLLEEWHNRR